MEEDFAYAKVCADTLCACSTAEPVAAKYLAVIQPLYDALVDKRQRLQYEKADVANALLHEKFRRSSAPLSTAQSHAEFPGVSSQPQPAAEPRDEEIISIVKKLSELLADPFSLGLKAKIQGVRETSNGVGTYSVLWWK